MCVPVCMSVSVCLSVFFDIPWIQLRSASAFSLPDFCSPTMIPYRLKIR